MEKYRDWLSFAIHPIQKSLCKWRTTKMGKPTVVIYTDGSCDTKGNGGYGVSLTCGDESIYLSGSAENTSSQKMELTAIIRALEMLKSNCNVVIFSDSQYAINCINIWIDKWRKHGWKKNDGQPVANLELIQRLYELKSKFRVRANWVKGHAGNVGNEIVDGLARMGSGIDSK